MQNSFDRKRMGQMELGDRVNHFKGSWLVKRVVSRIGEKEGLFRRY